MATATRTPQIKNLVGRVKKNKRAARAAHTYEQVRAVICKTTGTLRNRTAGRLRTAEWRKNVARDCAFPVLRDIFSSCCCLSAVLFCFRSLISVQLFHTTENFDRIFRNLWPSIPCGIFLRHIRKFEVVLKAIIFLTWSIDVIYLKLIGMQSFQRN